MTVAASRIAWVVRRCRLTAARTSGHTRLTSVTPMFEAAMFDAAVFDAAAFDAAAFDAAVVAGAVVDGAVPACAPLWAPSSEATLVAGAPSRAFGAALRRTGSRWS